MTEQSQPQESTVDTSTVKVNLGELYLDEVNVIIAALNELPAKHSYGLITKIREIVIPQLPEAPATEQAAEPEAK